MGFGKRREWRRKKARSLWYRNIKIIAFEVKILLKVEK
jgi:hypothetical protein